MRRHDGPDRGIMRTMMRRLASVLVCLLGLAGPCAPAFATATDLAAQFAPGSIETRDDIARAREVGFADYWTKPIDFKAIVSALEQRFATRGS